MRCRVIAFTALPPDLADPDFRLVPALHDMLSAVDNDGVIGRPGANPARADRSSGHPPPPILVPFDCLFEIRAVAAAVRLWRALTGHSPRPNPQSSRRCGAIASSSLCADSTNGLPTPPIARSPVACSATTPLPTETGFRMTSVTARLVRLDFTMIRCSYRCLLLYPYRRRK